MSPLVVLLVVIALYQKEVIALFIANSHKIKV